MHTNGGGEAAGRRTPVVVRWAYRTVNGIFVGAVLSTIAFLVMEGFGSKVTNSSAAWIHAYGLIYALIVAVVLVLVLLVHAVAARTSRS